MSISWSFKDCWDQSVGAKLLSLGFRDGPTDSEVSAVFKRGCKGLMAAGQYLVAHQMPSHSLSVHRGPGHLDLCAAEHNRPDVQWSFLRIWRKQTHTSCTLMLSWAFGRLIRISRRGWKESELLIITPIHHFRIMFCLKYWHKVLLWPKIDFIKFT